MGELRLATLIEMAESFALQHHDGHLTIMRFTTHWKVMFGTPFICPPEGWEQVWALVGRESLELALHEAIAAEKAKHP